MSTIPKFSSEDNSSQKLVVKKPVPIKSKAAMGEDYDDEETVRKPFGSTNLPSFDELSNAKNKPRKPLNIDQLND